MERSGAVDGVRQRYGYAALRLALGEVGRHAPFDED